MTMSRADPWGEFTFQKGFLWAEPLPACHGGSIADALISFPQSSRQWGMDEQQEEELEVGHGIHGYWGKGAAEI